MELARPSRKTNGVGVQVGDTQVCVVMVGLPARGKSLIAQKAQRYLKWLSIDAQVFNVGNYRRKGAAQPTADFFNVNNQEGERMRRAAAEAAVNDMIKWFKQENGIIAILDATNSTKARRRWIKERCDKEGIETLFVESKCDDEDLIMSNILEVKTTSPDYVGQDPERAAQDFRERIRNYEKVYETIDDTENDLTYLKIMNVGKQCIINAIQDYLQSRVVYYLMNLHIKRRSIWLSRHGESQYNVTGQIGGDANLSERGEKYALKLPELVKQSFEGEEHPLTVWTSTLKRTIATARHLPKEWNQLQWKALDELDSGVCDNMTYAEIAEEYPEDFEARDQDKYNYRYRGGESYRDVVIRLEPIIMELERSENILIVTHQAILRCIYAYFMKEDQERSPWLNVPLHCLIKLTPRAYGTEKVVYKANIDAVSTWRGKGSTAKHEDPTEETESLAKVADGHVEYEDVSVVGGGVSLVTSEGGNVTIESEFVKFPAHHSFSDPTEKEHMKFMAMMNTRGKVGDGHEVEVDTEIEDITSGEDDTPMDSELDVGGDDQMLAQVTATKGTTVSQVEEVGKENERLSKC